MTDIIDPPSPFAPRSDWEAHRKRMARLAAQDPTDQTAAEALAAAEIHLGEAE